MKSLIVGSIGFVGRYLITEIQNSLKTDIVTTKLPSQELERTDIETIDLDVLNYENVKKALETHKPYFIFYLVAQSSIALSWKNPLLTIDVNINGAINMLRAINETNIDTRILMVGSGEEYGLIDFNEVPLKEETLLRPGNIYSATKACQSMISSIYAKVYGIKTIMTRSFNHMGPQQLDNFVVADFCRQAIMIEKGLKEPVIRVGNLNAIRDFTDVRDVVKAYVNLIQFGDAGETYNVGSGNAVKINDILSLILKNTNAEIAVEIDQEKFRPIDIPIIQADISKIYNKTGWKPVISLETTIIDTLNYWREML